VAGWNCPVASSDAVACSSGAFFPGSCPGLETRAPGYEREGSVVKFSILGDGDGRGGFHFRVCCHTTRLSSVAIVPVGEASSSVPTLKSVSDRRWKGILPSRLAFPPFLRLPSCTPHQVTGPISHVPIRIILRNRDSPWSTRGPWPCRSGDSARQIRATGRLFRVVTREILRGRRSL